MEIFRTFKTLSGLAKSKNEQVQFAEFLDVDSDGALDLITGGHCGKKSYIFWNDGKGSYDNSNKTTIPLDYKKWGKRKCEFLIQSHRFSFLRMRKVIRFTGITSPTL